MDPRIAVLTGLLRDPCVPLLGLGYRPLHATVVVVGPLVLEVIRRLGEVAGAVDGQGIPIDGDFTVLPANRDHLACAVGGGTANGCGVPA